MENDNNLFTPIHRMPRATERSKVVFAAHRGKDLMLDVLGEAMLAAAAEFEAREREFTTLGELATVARAERDAAVLTLQRTKRRALELIAKDLPDFDTRGFTDSLVAEDAIAQSTTLRTRLEARANDGEVLPYADRLLGALASAQESAELALLAAHELVSKAGIARTERRAAAARLDGKLTTFRRIVRSVLGSKHRDYRILRRAAGRVAPADDLDIVELPDAGPDAIANDTDNPEQPEVPETASGTG